MPTSHLLWDSKEQHLVGNSYSSYNAYRHFVACASNNSAPFTGHLLWESARWRGDLAPWAQAPNLLRGQCRAARCAELWDCRLWSLQHRAPCPPHTGRHNCTERSLGQVRTLEKSKHVFEKLSFSEKSASVTVLQRLRNKFLFKRCL